MSVLNKHVCQLLSMFFVLASFLHASEFVFLSMDIPFLCLQNFVLKKSDNCFVDEMKYLSELSFFEGKASSFVS